MPRKPPLKAVKVVFDAHADIEAIRAEPDARERKDKNDRGIGEKLEKISPGKGQKFHIMPDGTKVATDDIIELVRTLLPTSFPGEIKRVLAKRFGGRGLSYVKHIAIARARNRGLVSKELIDTKSESIFSRAKSIQDTVGFRTNALRAMSKSQKVIDETQAKIDTGDYVDDKGLAKLLLKLKTSQDQFDRAKENHAYFDAVIERNQATMDRILGNHAPIQIEQKTTVNGGATPSEPLTHAEGDAALREMIQRVKDQVEKDTADKARIEAREVVSNPSEN